MFNESIDHGLIVFDYVALPDRIGGTQPSVPQANRLRCAHRQCLGAATVSGTCNTCRNPIDGFLRSRTHPRAKGPMTSVSAMFEAFGACTIGALSTLGLTTQDFGAAPETDGHLLKSF